MEGTKDAGQWKRRLLAGGKEGWCVSLVSDPPRELPGAASGSQLGAAPGCQVTKVTLSWPQGSGEACADCSLFGTVSLLGTVLGSSGSPLRPPGVMGWALHLLAEQHSPGCGRPGKGLERLYPSCPHPPPAARFSGEEPVHLCQQRLPNLTAGAGAGLILTATPSLGLCLRPQAAEACRGQGQEVFPASHPRRYGAA